MKSKAKAKTKLRKKTPPFSGAKQRKSLIKRQIPKKTYNDLLYPLKSFITGILKAVGYVLLWPVKVIYRISVFILETIGAITVFLVISIVRLPSLPFIILWDGWLYLTKPSAREFKAFQYSQAYIRFKTGLYDFFQDINCRVGSFFYNLSNHQDPGLRFCYAFIRTPKRFLVTTIIFLALSTNFYYFVLKDLPSPYKLKRVPALSTKIFARDCTTLLYKIYRNENRTMVPLDQIPPIVRNATIAIEDKDFYHHHGYSVSGILRALSNNFRHQKTQGGSTITQQLIKNTVLTSERTYERKIKELVLSIEAELIFNKDQILQMYLNEVAYGGPAYGIEEASQMYLGKSVKDLNVAEASFLAGLPAAPSDFSPYTAGVQIAKTRQKEVLKQMVKNSYITLEQARTAYATPLAILPPRIPIKYPHFVMYVKDELERQYGQKAVEEDGLTVCTTLDTAIQDKAQAAVTEEVDKIKIPYQVGNGAALVTNPKNGEILAMVGSRDYWDKANDGNVNLTISERQPGSSIKLVNYAYALGHGYTPSSIIQDNPISYRNAWETYTPVNYDGKFRGNVTLRQALAMSLNIPAVKVLNSYGVDKMVDLGRQMGITTWTDAKHFGLSLTLGAAEVKMTDMAVVYGTVANMGKRVTVSPFLKITDPQGKVLEDSQKRPSLAIAKDVQAKEEDTVIKPLVAYQLIDILSDNVARTPEFGPRSSLYIPNAQVAVKTGTSNSFRDNWTIGFTPNLLVAAWVGNNDNKPMSGISSGITGAAPIWNRIMTDAIALDGAEQFATPSGMIKVKICAANGLLPCAGCPSVKEEWFVPGSEPKKACYMPKPEECQGKKAQMESEHKSAEEIVAALTGCPLSAPTPQP